MKVLFVSSGNSTTGISPIITNQGKSLKKQGIELDYFPIKGIGVKGYLKMVPKLRMILNDKNYDVIHAHYSKSAFAASLAGAKPLVVSLMGSDVKSKGYFQVFIKFFKKYFWVRTIVKSKDMKESLGINDIEIIPNGVDFNKFRPINKNIALREMGWDTSKKHILFPSNPKRFEKNYKLANSSFKILDNQRLELHYLDNVPNERMNFYYNAVDLVILTSLWEGSPNVIKEAMACNIPIVSTDVGDVREVIEKTEGCFMTTFEPEDVANKIKMSLNFGKETNGREDIKHLDSSIIAEKIINIYKDILKK